jgi:Flp pilus assembly protein TadD
LNGDDAMTAMREADSLLTLKRFDEAEGACRRALQLAPYEPRLYYQLGIALWELRRYEEAEQAQRRALALEPRSAEAHYELANALFAMKRLEEGEGAYQRALALRPKFAEAQTGLARLVFELGRPEEALARCRLALALQPTYWLCHAVLGNALRDLGRFKEAETAYRRAIALAPPAEATVAKFNLGILFLSLGDFKRGWPLYEARFEVNQPGWPAENKPQFSFPRWNGDDLSGKSLLIWPEQGFGDALQFARYVPLLQRMGARVTLACWPALKALFQSLHGADAIITNEEIRNESHDYWTFLASVPRHIGTEMDSIPGELPYLRASAERTEAWRSRLPQAGFKVGLVWKGRADHLTYRHLESFTGLRPLWDVQRVSFVNLQKGQDETVGPFADQPIVQLGRDIADFADTAAIVSQLDLVICVDTAIAHLAGALGKRVWMLLPSSRTDWRWLRERQDSPWYPGVMRLFRQQRDGDWDKTVATVADALRLEVASNRASAA